MRDAKSSTNRRDFLLRTVATGGLLALGAERGLQIASAATKSSPLKILILGGTGDIGPYMVATALERGHQVAVFSRGKSQADLPASVERLIGDRNSDLSSIKGRDWDAVIDVATFTSDWVKSLGEALGNRAKHYLFISTVSVYDHPELNDRTVETSQVLEGGTSRLEKYGTNKVLCEREANRQFPGRVVVLRPSYIVGPGDDVGFLTFWPLRMRKGGEVLAPGDPRLPFQCVDVRDLAAFAISAVEKRSTGTFNVVGPATPTTFGQMLETARTLASPAAKLTWVPAARVVAQPDKDIWTKPMFWSWSSETVGQANIMRMSNERALAEGLTLRPLKTTLADAVAWYQQQPADVQLVFAPGYKKSQPVSEQPSAQELWDKYLQREKQVLDEWRAGRAGQT